MFTIGGELYSPHDALKTGYAQAGLRRIVLSHLDFIDWISGLQQKDELFEIAAQADNIPITHSRLRRIGWQLRLSKRGELDFVSVRQYNFMTKNPSELWRLIVLELNSDIF